MDNVLIKVKLNEDDVVEFQKAHYSRLVNPGMRYVILAVIAVMLIINVAIDISNGTYITITSGLLAVILIVLLGTPLMFRLSARKSLRTNKMLMAENTYTFTKDGIASFSEHVTLDTTWDTMHDFCEVKGHFLFYIGNNQAFMIPKRCFDGNYKDQALVRDWASAIPEPKKKSNLMLIFMGVILVIIIILFVILMILN